RGRRKNGQKGEGYYTEWFEPKLLIITQFDQDGKKIKSVSPILDGSCGGIDDFLNCSKNT
ncbi:MAG: ISLre2 family transposase, partial [Mariprofundaceae bacterium]|nr:ISLre2 family transposase [Mariprofundaceae bacterium]